MAKRRTDAELGRLIRKAINGRRIKRRRRLFPYDRSPNPYLESDYNFLSNNHAVAAAILEAILGQDAAK